jgi:cytochrome b561
MSQQPIVDDPRGRKLSRYSLLSIVLHWSIATLIFVQIGLGWYMNEVLPDHSPAQDRVQDLHVSVGLTTLLLVFVRVFTRLAVPVPELPRGFATWESNLARAVHILFYALMLALPLSGWLLVTVRHEPIALWGLHWPALPGLDSVSGAAQRSFGRAAKHFHIFTLIWIALVMIALHLAGAIKHQFDGHAILWRMWPQGRKGAL